LAKIWNEITSLSPYVQRHRCRIQLSHTKLERVTFCVTVDGRAVNYRSCAWTVVSVFSPVEKGKGSPYSIIERGVPELILVLGSQPAGDVSHKPGGRLPLLLVTPAITPAILKRAVTNFAAW